MSSNVVYLATSGHIIWDQTMPKNIFISYARRDGRMLALQLKADLEEATYPVWLDTAEIEGGASWSSEIEDAIESCDVALILMSQGAYESEICRAEQLRALRKGKYVIPVLVQSDAERPLHLEHLNYRDFTDPLNYVESLRQLQVDIDNGQHTPLPDQRRHTIVSAPALPPHFIMRDEALDELRRTVLGDATDQQIALTALRGMGGIGKSVLSAALCHDEIVQAAFPDGIIWVTIGREPGNLTEQMKFIGTKLGDSPGYYTSENAGHDRLQTILANKAVLLVLDDVWDARHIEPFRLTAPRMRTLFSTRDGGIALAVGASEVRLDTLKPFEALALVREWAGRDDPEMAAIAERLGYLPLALKLAGARLREGMTGAEWLQTFQHVAQIKLGRRSVDPHENLEVCFDLSVQQLVNEDQLLYYTFGVFPEDVGIPQQTVVRLWRHLEPALSAYDASELIIDLARLALIDRDADSETITLHDLLHDYTRGKLGDRLGEMHVQLLQAYNPANDPWPTISHDGYLYFQLGYHLIGAGQRDQFMDLLLTSPDWLEAKFIACQGDIAYVADLDLAQRQYRDPLTAEEAAQVARLYVARQIVNVRTSVYTDDDLTTLVWLGRSAEALNHARLRLDQTEKADGLLAIYRAALAAGRTDADIKDELLRAVRDIGDTSTRQNYLKTCIRLLRDHDDPSHQSLFDEWVDLEVQNASFARVWRDPSSSTPRRSITEQARHEEAERNRRIQDGASRMRRLYALAMRLEAIDVDAATGCYKLAEQLYDRVPDWLPKLIEQGHAALAVDIAATLGDDALRAVSRACFDAGAMDEALRAAQQIEGSDEDDGFDDESDSQKMLVELAIRCADAGLFAPMDQALDMAGLREHDGVRLLLVHALSYAGHLDRARNILVAMSSHYWSDSASLYLEQIAEMWREAGRDAVDMALLDQISQPPPPITPTFDPPARPAPGSDARTESSSNDDPFGAAEAVSGSFKPADDNPFSPVDFDDDSAVYTPKAASEINTGTPSEYDEWIANLGMVNETSTKSPFDDPFGAAETVSGSFKPADDNPFGSFDVEDDLDENSATPPPPTASGFDDFDDFDFVEVSPAQAEEVKALMQQAVDTYRAGQHDAARDLLMKVVDIDERNETAWLWLSALVEDVQVRKTCLENVLYINPKHRTAQRILNQLTEGRTDVMPEQLDGLRDPFADGRIDQCVALVRAWQLVEAEVLFEALDDDQKRVASDITEQVLADMADDLLKPDRFTAIMDEVLARPHDPAAALALGILEDLIETHISQDDNPAANNNEAPDDE